MGQKSLKRSQAREIYLEMKQYDQPGSRHYIIQRMQHEMGLSAKGAMSYFSAAAQPEQRPSH